MKTCQETGELRFQVMQTLFYTGEQIVVNDGPFNGSEGIVVEDGKSRIVLSLPVKDRKVTVEMDRKWISRLLVNRRVHT